MMTRLSAYSGSSSPVEIGVRRRVSLAVDLLCIGQVRHLDSFEFAPGRVGRGFEPRTANSGMYALFGAEPTVRYWRPKRHTDHTREAHGMTHSCIFRPITLALTEALPWLSG